MIVNFSHIKCLLRKALSFHGNLFSASGLKRSFWQCYCFWAGQIGKSCNNICHHTILTEPQTRVNNLSGLSPIPWLQLRPFVSVSPLRRPPLEWPMKRRYPLHFPVWPASCSRSTSKEFCLWLYQLSLYSRCRHIYLARPKLKLC